LEDRISQLPDEILADILSLLKMKEAGRSSVLSHRWRDLWKFTSSLNFDASKTLLKVFGRKHEPERSKYVAWVNQVLKLHLCPSLDEFRVGFYLDSRNSCDIDEWINFVIPKRVKILEIDLHSSSFDTRYTQCYLCFKSPSNLSSIKCLTSLSLGHVNVRGELIEYFLSNCPNLEQLRMFCLDQIVNLNVSGPSLQLKHLEIFRCELLESLEFCAPKLVTFKYFGQTSIRLSLGSLPLLAELDIGAARDHQATYALVPFSSYLSQIETLNLHTWLPKEYMEIPRIVELTKLKHLILDFDNYYGSRFPCFTSLVEAAPSLHKLTIKWSSSVRSRAILSKTLTPHPHEFLKDVEIFGFVDRKLVMRLLQNAINLEKITIDPYHPSDKCEKSKEKERARKRAHKLRERFPSGVKLIVL